MNNRKDKRKNEENKAVIELVEGKADSANKTSINALTQNISLSGVRLQSDNSFPVDTNINLQITLSKSKKILKLNGNGSKMSRMANYMKWELNLLRHYHTR